MIALEEIRAGLRGGAFCDEYLPVVSLDDGRCTGAEALVRWRRPCGVVPALDFIPTAENTPPSGLITYWVFDTVALEMLEWLRAHPEADLALNVPPEIIGRGGIAHVAHKSGLIGLASQIVLEMTERGLPDTLALETINRAKAHGIRVALDDVTLQSAANLAILARANFDIVNLDRSLAAQITPQGPPPEWQGDLALLTRSTRLVVIAEGIETAHPLSQMRAAGVQAAQGYYFSPPLPARDFMAYHRDRQAGLGSAP